MNDQFYKKQFGKGEEKNDTAKMRDVTPEMYGMMASHKSEPEKYYPGFSVQIKDIPEAKKWEIGKSYTIEAEVVMTNLNLNKNKEMAGFELRKIKAS